MVLHVRPRLTAVQGGLASLVTLRRDGWHYLGRVWCAATIIGSSQRRYKHTSIIVMTVKYKWLVPYSIQELTILLILSDFMDIKCDIILWISMFDLSNTNLVTKFISSNSVILKFHIKSWTVFGCQMSSKWSSARPKAAQD